MTILNADTRRSRSYAAPASPDWKTRSVCRGEFVGKLADDFYSTIKSRKERARALCVGCPVIVECLSNQRQSDDAIYRWGVGGGLDPEQRRALELEELLGNVPNLAMARVLVSPRWLWRLRQLKAGCRSLEGMTAALREDGLFVDVVTVRVAVWWSGGQGSRMARLGPGDRRSWRAQLRDDYVDVIVALHERGARRADIAAYLGIPSTNGAKGVSDILRAVTETEAAA
ncbi:WhiB family transcriptional regulator [Streptomyces sp. sk2.1]|uniref:WhiB family transcriptional regulator n=1 Tax=Streptomyces sp. sk2.1 TaxID=2478959 RepID=UPI0011E81DE2|nr:WhiB family transcriptional regulator [Streptomyces sp. sk2.1]TXS68887.1 WhiB family transcriptional regulator [Streptomyces sp. sk2.1]